jgi:glucosamine--fructose-6-phosphate aminotransferase (isomerizing)
MCGIVGILGNDAVADRLLDGLKRLEYRGYDSAGIATIVEAGAARRRAEGKLVNLGKVLAEEPLPGTVGIAHTRWATHGGPTTNNAHPHATQGGRARPQRHHREFQAAARRLQARGRVFESETDTEVVAHLVSEQVEAGSPQSRRCRPCCRSCTAPSRSPSCSAASRHADRRAPRFAAGRRLWRGRDLSRLRRARARAADQRRSPIWKMATGSSSPATARRSTTLSTTIAVERADQSTSGARRRLVDKGNHRHFMAEGDPRAAEVVVARRSPHYIDSGGSNRK